MSAKVTAPLLMVGSVALENEEHVFEKCGRLLGDALFALPDGETGERAIWVTHEAYRLFRPHPDVETVAAPVGPTGREIWHPMHLFNCWVFKLRDGVKRLHFERLPRIDDALNSYKKFVNYRNKGVIPKGVKFQLCIPLTESVMGWWFRPNFAHDYPIIEAAYADLMDREMKRLLKAIPADDLVVQWDICFEVLDLVRLFQWTPKEGAWERFIEPIKQVSRMVPDDVIAGYHLCYGTLAGWPMKEQEDLALSVRMANAIAKEAGRRIDYYQLAGPRPNRSEETDFYKPLEKLEIGDARVYLGLVHDLDGADGLRRRVRMARRYLPDFGISAACGFGRRPGEEMETTLKTHRQDVDAFLDELKRA